MISLIRRDITDHTCQVVSMSGSREEIIDVHMHCFAGRDHAPQLAGDMEALRGHGVRNLVVGLEFQPGDANTIDTVGVITEG